ncbi:MAG TPA: prolyl oligopeptidase family serine peptidase, partial [Longimicrobiaceae bacterium]
EEPARPAVPEGPIVFESYGRTAPTRTYQDLLDGPHAERLFEHYFTGQLARVSRSGEHSFIGDPGIISGFAPSPSGELVLVERIHRPFSYLVPYHRFPTEVRVVDTSGALVRDLADLPLAEEVPVAFDAVPAGPRAFHWRSDAPAELVWVEALDGGDPRVQADARDRLIVLRAMDAEPHPLLDLEHRFAGVHWGSDEVALLYTRWWVTRTERRILIRPGDPTVPPTVLSDRSYQDVYHDPGWPVTTPNAAGKLVLMLTGRGRSIYLAGEGASPRGSYPFLDRLDLDTGETERIWECEEGVYEQVAAVLDRGAERILTRRESPVEPPNYHLRNLSAGTSVGVTDFPDPAPQLAGIRRQLITYPRADGVSLNATLITPPGYDPKRDGSLPLLVWAYPREFRDADDAGQVDDSPNRFSRPAGASHLFLLTQGYAILDGPTMPIIGEGEVEPNDSYVAQLVASAQAAVKAVVEMGVADPERIAVGGHSYGAFMTANLLAHTDLFRAGIARSGAYNRTLTPFGFQQEQRTYWEAAETYHQMSPFTHADRLRAPILLVHGEADNNSGTFPLQSERFYHALKGHGATVRYVVLPHESHAYRARESVLHTLAEMVEWLGKWVGAGAPPPP